MFRSTREEEEAGMSGWFRNKSELWGDGEAWSRLALGSWSKDSGMVRGKEL